MCRGAAVPFIVELLCLFRNVCALNVTSDIPKLGTIPFPSIYSGKQQGNTAPPLPSYGAFSVPAKRGGQIEGTVRHELRGHGVRDGCLIDGG